MTRINASPGQPSYGEPSATPRNSEGQPMTARRTEATVAGLLFLTATGATVASQTLLPPLLADPVASLPAQRPAFLLGILLELANALASAGIALALYPALKSCNEGFAIGYVGLRMIEAALGAVAAVALRPLLDAAAPGLAAYALGLHHWAFLSVLLVFSLDTALSLPIALNEIALAAWLIARGLTLPPSSP
jgi:hypothetical protein